MTSAAYEQLLVLVKHAIADNPPDDQVRRLSKGLAKALTRMLQMQRPDFNDQARIGMPRPRGLASVNASLDNQRSHDNGEDSRTERRDPDR